MRTSATFRCFKICLTALGLLSSARAGPIECIKAGVEFVFVDLGTYTLTETLDVPSGVTIYCQPGAVFEAAPGAFKGIHDSLVRLKGSQNVSIFNCTFRMRKSEYVPPDYPDYSEWRHAIELLGVTNVHLSSVRVEDAGGDGVYAGPMVTGMFTEDRQPCRQVTIERLTASDNYRTGVAITSCIDCKITDSVFENTKGTSTQSGVDLEPDHGGDRLVNVVFERCTARNNAGSAYTVQMIKQNQNSKPVSVTFKDCSWSGVPVNHYGIRVMEFGSNQSAVKPIGTVFWDLSRWSNPP